MDKTIHTLNARGNVMLEVMRDYLMLSPQIMNAQINIMKNEVVNLLNGKKINYDDLKSALTPDRKRKEMVFIFDTNLIESDWYGNDVFKQIIPLFKKESNHSILVGDYIGSSFNQDFLYSIFRTSVKLTKKTIYRHSSQFYMVYINNLSSDMITCFKNGLKNYSGYIGYADMSFQSSLKIVLSTMLVNLFIKNKNNIIQGHESDRSNDENINMCGYDFEDYGYHCKSLASDLFGVLLSYKIERPVIDGFKEDTHFSLNAVHINITDLDSLSILVEEARLKYLRDNKKESLLRAGLEKVSAREMEKLIKEKINSSYIYSMAYISEYNFSKFNILLEFKANGKQVKLLAAMRYKPEINTLELLTLF
ncbi:hypothetical protein H5A38_05000 [Pectobacterium brasiliense]|uniref:hypothetical protein n=1 Tax=Pectobacterium brasiliense TaxID=180957 RepID=UPI0019693A80|nr:hypothetical protein [Pectobacterium brasiliense]QSD23705.1 hypothetical protein H5A38_05000 [Pectobacterium brasiliense]